VISSYHQLYRIEKSFRMTKSDLRASLRESIEAHLTIVFAAIAVGHWIEDATGMSIKKFVNTAKAVRTTLVRIGDHIIPADDDVPLELATALADIRSSATAHPV